MTKNSKEFREKIVQQITLSLKKRRPLSDKNHRILEKWLDGLEKKFPQITEGEGIDVLSIPELKKLKVEVDKLEKELKA